MLLGEPLKQGLLAGALFRAGCADCCEFPSLFPMTRKAQGPHVVEAATAAAHRDRHDMVRLPKWMLTGRVERGKPERFGRADLDC